MLRKINEHYMYACVCVYSLWMCLTLINVSHILRKRVKDKEKGGETPQ